MTINEIAKKILSFESVLIFSHNRPDGDTLGSAFAVKLALEKIGKRVCITCASPIPEKYSIFKESKSVKLPQEVQESYSCHLAVDCSTENMIGDAYGLFIKNKNTFNIDHHDSNTKYASYNFVEDKASCCEIIYDFIKAVGVEIDEDIANSVLLGTVTDTGNFMHSNTTENTLAVASELVGKGANLHAISYAMFKNQKIERAKLYANTINNIRFFEDGKIAIISIFKSDFEKFYATQDMTEGFIDFPLSIEGVEVAVSIMESKQNCYKVSFRSKGKINVNEVASSFGGGGHVLASGCVVCGFYEDVKEKIIRAISINL